MKLMVYTQDSLDGAGCRILARVWANVSGCDMVDVIHYPNVCSLINTLVQQFGACSEGKLTASGSEDIDQIQQVLVTGIAYEPMTPILLNYLSAMTSVVPVLAIGHDPHINYNPMDTEYFRCGCTERKTICELNLDYHIQSTALHDNCGWHLPIHCDTYKLWGHLVHLLGVKELDHPSYVLLAHEVNYATTYTLGALPASESDTDMQVHFSTSCANRSKAYPDTSIDVWYSCKDAITLLYLLEYLGAEKFEDYITSNLQFIQENYPVAQSNDLFSIYMPFDKNAKAVRASMEAYQRIYQRVTANSTLIKRVKALDGTCMIDTAVVFAPPVPAFLYPELARFVEGNHTSHPDAVIIHSGFSECATPRSDGVITQFYTSNSLPCRIRMSSFIPMMTIEATHIANPEIPDYTWNGGKPDGDEPAIKPQN